MTRRDKLIAAVVMFALALLLAATMATAQVTGDGKFRDLTALRTVYIGDGTNQSYLIYLDNGDANSPYIMYDANLSMWAFADDGSTKHVLIGCGSNLENCSFNIDDSWAHGQIELPFSPCSDNACIGYVDLTDTITVHNGVDLDIWYPFSSDGDDKVPIGTGSGFGMVDIPNCVENQEILRYTAASNTFACENIPTIYGYAQDAEPTPPAYFATWYDTDDNCVYYNMYNGSIWQWYLMGCT